MRAEHLREWLREHRATEAAAEADMEAEGETLGTEERESATNEGISEGGEERDPTKWEMVVELEQIPLRDGVLVEEAAYQVVVLI